MGEYKYRDIIKPDGIPAIVTEDLFQRVQRKMAKNKKAPARIRAEDSYLLTTKLFCGTDNVYMVGESGTSKMMKVHRYYRCVNTKKKRLCNRKPVKKDLIEDMVVNSTMELVNDNNVVRYIVDIILEEDSRVSSDLPLLTRQLEETNKAINNMLDAIQQGLLTSSTRQRLDELENTKSELEVRILQEQMVKPLLTKEQLVYWIHRFRNTDITNREQRQRLIDIFVNSVYVFDDHVVISFNYRDGTKTVTLAEVESAGLGSSLSLFGAPSPLGQLFM